MKKVIVFLNVIFIISSCISAAPVVPHSDKRVTVVASMPVKHVCRKPPTKVKKKRIVIGTCVNKLPSQRVVVYCNNMPYYYIDGVFYKKLSTSSYEVVKPEIGMIAPRLPEFNVDTVCIFRGYCI